MSRRKEEISQRDFGFGATRPESVERDDTPLVQEAMKEAENTIGLTTGSVELRPGMAHIGTSDAKSGVEVDLGSGRVYDVHVVPDGVVIYNRDGSIEASFLAATWTSITDRFGASAFADVKFWVLPDPDTSSILIGAQDYPTHALTVTDAGVWSFGAMEFATTLAGASLQPFYNYYRGVTIQPSARTGSITLTASAGIWTAGHVGLRVRYLEREIVLGSLVSATVINATVVQELPPTFNLTVASVSGYQIGEAVEHNTLGGQGVITGISGSVVTVLATGLWSGFGASNKLVGPNADSTISGKADASPAASSLWDMQMQSPIHGYAGWGAKHKGRAYLCDYPGAPQAFAVSVAGAIDDFTMGVNDGDGFVETLGANSGGDLKFIISAEDLLFFTTRGLYYQQTRNGSDVTPQTIGPISFSKMGCADVVPVAVDDGAIFVDSVGEQIHAAVLSGDVYRSWTTQNISQYHSHLINGPLFLGATASGSEKPEQFVYVVNADGGAAVCQWDRAANKIGWRPWSTEGAFVAIYQAFGKTYAIVDRTIDGTARRFRERFETGLYMDCVSALKISASYPAGEIGSDYFGGVTKAAIHLDGHTATIYFEGWDLGDRVINGSGFPLDANGNVLDYPMYEGIVQAGLPFSLRITPWPRRSVNTQRGKRDVKRTTKMMFTVQDTLGFEFDGQSFGGYRTNEPLNVPPRLRNEEVVFITGGRSHFEDRTLTLARPGPFRLLKLKYRVTV